MYTNTECKYFTTFLYRANARITSFHVTKEDILLIIKTLDSSKAHGWDNISIKMIKIWAMYKNRNTGTGNGMQGKRGMGGILYSEECRQTFREMSPNIPGNVLKHSGKYRQTFRGTFFKHSSCSE